MVIIKNKIRLALFAYLLPAFICWLLFRLVSFIIEPDNSVINSVIAYGVYIILIIFSFVGSFMLAIAEKSRGWEVRLFFTLTSVILFLPIVFVVAPLGALFIWLGAQFQRSKNSKWGCTITSMLGLTAMFVTCLFFKQKGNLKAFRTSKRVIVVINHKSASDYFLATLVGMFTNYRIMIGANLWSWRVFHWFFDAVGVPIAREKEKVDEKIKAMESSKEFLCSGDDNKLIVFSEGTRNRTDKPMLDFASGAFRIAYDLGIDVHPVVFIGAEKWRKPGKQTTTSFVRKRGISAKSLLKQGVNFVDRVFRHGINPTRVKIYYLDPISSLGKTYQELRDETHRVMTEAYLTYSKVKN